MRNRRTRIILAATLLAMTGLPVVLWWWVGLGSAKRIFEPTADVQAPVALVLGAAARPNGEPSGTFADRLWAARTLYKAGRVQKILVTGDHGTVAYDELGAAQRWLLGQGVPASDIVLDHAGFRTLDSMHRARAVFGVKRVLICTQAFHLPRALFLADAFGLEARGIRADRSADLAKRYNNAREFFARLRAFLDVYVLRTRARLLGPAIDVHGDGRITHDRSPQLEHKP